MTKATEKPARKRGGRPTNAAMGRTREHLTHEEAEKLIKAAGEVGRNRLRDRTLCLLLYRHGLRVSEATDLRWSQVDLNNRTLHVCRLKNGNPSGHPLQHDTCQALMQLRDLNPESDYVLTSERGTRLDRVNAGRIVKRAGEKSKIPLRVHPHMLRHATGHFLANNGHGLRLIQDYLGHRSVQHTVHYTRLAPDRFSHLWSNR